MLNINEEKYNFLRTDERLTNTIYLTYAGSRAYGLNNENSDYDLRGVFVPTDKYLLGLSECEQVADSITDTTIFAFNKFIKLAMGCNPNIIELLATNPEHVVVNSIYSNQVREMLPFFLSKLAANTFSGYAYAQLRRLTNALAHDSYPEREKVIHMEKTLNTMIPHLEVKYGIYSEDVKIYSAESNKEDIGTELFVDMNLKKFPLQYYASMMSEMTEVLRNYEKLNHRNRKKDDGHLLKHAMHLVRLFRMGTEILSGEGVQTYRTKDRQQLLDIRNGLYTFEQIFAMVEEEDKKIKYALKNSDLPLKADSEKIEKFVIDVHKNFIVK